jgi:hypothetical protein
MSGKDAQIPQAKPQQPKAREVRLKAALKANLARRKAQARARASEADNDTPGTTGADNNDR